MSCFQFPLIWSVFIVNLIQVRALCQQAPELRVPRLTATARRRLGGLAE
jgi:hypothetical protein